MSNVKNKKNQLRAVIYARYSDDNQRIESIEGQIRECTEFAKEQGYTLVGTYTDKARTGKNDKRQGFQKMYLDSFHPQQAKMIYFFQLKNLFYKLTSKLKVECIQFQDWF